MITIEQLEKGVEITEDITLYTTDDLGLYIENTIQIAGVNDDGIYKLVECLNCLLDAKEEHKYYAGFSYRKPDIKSLPVLSFRPMEPSQELDRQIEKELLCELSSWFALQEFPQPDRSK